MGAKRGLVAAQSVFLTALREVSCSPQRCIRIQKKLGFTPGILDHPPSGSLGGTRVVGGARSTSAAFELGEQVRRVAPDQVSRDELRTDAPTRVWENPLILYLLIRFFLTTGRLSVHAAPLCGGLHEKFLVYPLFFFGQPFPATSSNEFSSSPVPHVPIHMLPELTSSVLPSYPYDFHMFIRYLNDNKRSHTAG